MIEVRHLRKSFGTHLILDDVSLRVENGESVVIIGLLTPDSGQVLIDGENIVPLDERQLLRVRRKFGMLFQGAALFDSMTVEENIAFAFRRDRSLPENEIAAKVAHVL